MQLEENILRLRSQRDILLMTHLVLGYPSFEENERLIEEMAQSDVELIEMQIPFSEPTADGMIIAQANQESLINGTRVSACFNFAKTMSDRYPQINFLFMTYTNIPFCMGHSIFVQKSAASGIKGLIIPDLPPEESEEYLEASQKYDVSNIFIFTPNQSPERIKKIGKVSTGMVYGVLRKGVTGEKTDVTATQEILERYRRNTTRPLGVGFGISEKKDVSFLIGKVDAAVIGSKLIRIYQEKGTQAVGHFLKNLRS